MVSVAKLSIIYQAVPPKLLGERIKNARLTVGLSGADLVESSGLSTVDLERIEAGQRRPGFTRLGVMAGSLGVTLEHLLGVDEPMPGGATDSP